VLESIDCQVKKIRFVEVLGMVASRLNVGGMISSVLGGKGKKGRYNQPSISYGGGSYGVENEGASGVIRNCEVGGVKKVCKRVGGICGDSRKDSLIKQR